jgi:hypothetical protein
LQPPTDAARTASTMLMPRKPDFNAQPPPVATPRAPARGNVVPTVSMAIGYPAR